MSECEKRRVRREKRDSLHETVINLGLSEAQTPFEVHPLERETAEEVAVAAFVEVVLVMVATALVEVDEETINAGAEKKVMA